MIRIRRNGVELAAGYISCRKKPCLYIRYDCKVNVIGYLINDECIEQLRDAIDYVVNGNETPYISEIMA